MIEARRRTILWLIREAGRAIMQQRHGARSRRHDATADDVGGGRAAARQCHVSPALDMNKTGRLPREIIFDSADYTSPSLIYTAPA